MNLRTIHIHKAYRYTDIRTKQRGLEEKPDEKSETGNRRSESEIDDLKMNK